MRVAVPPMPGRIAPTAMSTLAHMRCRVLTVGAVAQRREHGAADQEHHRVEVHAAG